MSPFPKTVDLLTSEWLTQVLGYNVKSFEVQPFSEGMGIIGQVTRLRLQADQGPQTVIAKFPSMIPENREVALQYKSYQKEYRFYTEIASTIPVRAPQCYFAAFEPENHDFVLLLEDLQALRLGDQVQGCSEAEILLVIESLAKLHAATWAPDPGMDLPLHDNSWQREGMVAGFQMGWPVVQERFPELIPEAVLATGAKMPDRIVELMEDFCREPLCIGHGDVRLDNLFFGDNEVIFVDWQAICLTAPEHDLAYFLTQSVPAQIREKEDWVRLYHEVLVSRGIDYSLEDCRRRYKVCGLYLLCYAVIIGGILDMSNERGRALAKTVFGNSISSLVAIGAFDLLN